MSWWWWLAWVAAAVALNAVLVPRVRRRAVARGFREGRVAVSARALDADAAEVPRRWHVARAVSRNGGLVLQRATDHPSQQGLPLVFVAPAERRLGLGESLRLGADATVAVVATTPAGRVELAGSRTAIGWLREQLDPSSRPG